MNDRPRYVLHPGDVPSRSDGDWHYVGVGPLREMYMIPSNARVVVIKVAEAAYAFRAEEGDIHCWPRADGKYLVFEPKEEGRP